jgi:hypothetical protein
MDQTRAFRFGILTGGAASRKAWIEKAKQAESLGYSTLLIDDHLYNNFALLTHLSALRMQRTPCALEALCSGMIFVIRLSSPKKWLL